MAAVNAYAWSLRKVDAPRAWTITRGRKDIIVAVIDTGVDPHHPELEGRVLRGHNVLAPHRPATDDNGHGTAVAGIIAAAGRNEQGISGVAPGVSILPVKVNEQGTGAVAARTIAQGIRWAVGAGASVINASVGVVQWEHGLTDEQLDELQEAIRYALRHGVVVCCAAGPPGGPPPFPGTWSALWAFRGLIAVGGTDNADQRAGCSPAGPFLSVTAPSDGTPTIYPRAQGRLYGTFGGTSAASPHVSAAAALMRSIQPALKPADVKAILQRTADKLRGGDYHPDYGHGRLNVARAVEAAAQWKATEL